MSLEGSGTSHIGDLSQSWPRDGGLDSDDRSKKYEKHAEELSTLPIVLQFNYEITMIAVRLGLLSQELP